MRQLTHAFMKTAAETLPIQGPVYEFGVAALADDVGPRDVFSDQCYIGWELPSQGADGLAEMDRLPFPDGAARTAVCIDVLERLVDPRPAMAELLRILAPGGMLLVTSRCSRPVAAGAWHPNPAEMETLLSGFSASLVGWQGLDRYAHTIYAIAAKRPVPGRFLPGANAFLAQFGERLEAIEQAVPWHRRCRRWLGGWRLTRLERAKRRAEFKTQFLLDFPAGQPFDTQWLAGPAHHHSSSGRRIDTSI